MKKGLMLTLLSFLIYTAVSSQPCPPNPVIFNTQSQIDSFIINYPNCTTIQGDVEISGNDITNLNGLSHLHIWGSLDIIDNIALTNLSGLEGKGFLGGLRIANNPVLKNLDGLKNLISIQGGVTISNNPSITNLNGLAKVQYVDKNITISHNDSLINLSGLENIGKAAGLRIENNPSLTSLKGLDNFQYINGYGVFMIANNPSLTDLTALNNCTYTGYTLLIDNNDALTSLSGLENITKVNMYLTIAGNASLVDLSALYNIATIGYLKVYDNASLQTLNGLDSIKNINFDISIYNNPCLATCHVKSICDYLANPNGVVEIHDNATGCNSQHEVEDRCNTIFSIYPNPARNELFIIIGNNVTLKEMNIYNCLAQKVLHETQINNMLDVSKLKQGMYIFELISTEFIKREKLIIK